MTRHPAVLCPHVGQSSRGRVRTTRAQTRISIGTQGQWGVDGNVRFVKYYAGNVAAVGAAGRGIGTGLAVGTGVAPAFPPASRLSTSWPMQAATSTQTKRALPLTASAHFARPAGWSSRASLARRWFALQSIRRKPCVA